MVRKIAGILALLFVAGLAAAQDAPETKKDAKKPDFVFGLFESYKEETLTLKIENKEKTFKVPLDTPVGYSAGKDKTKILKAKEHLKDVKKGTNVTVTLDGKKVLAIGVFVTELPKGKDEDTDK